MPQMLDTTMIITEIRPLLEELLGEKDFVFMK